MRAMLLCLLLPFLAACGEEESYEERRDRVADEFKVGSVPGLEGEYQLLWIRNPDCKLVLVVDLRPLLKAGHFKPEDVLAAERLEEKEPGVLVGGQEPYEVEVRPNAYDGYCNFAIRFPKKGPLVFQGINVGVAALDDNWGVSDATLDPAKGRLIRATAHPGGPKEQWGKLVDVQQVAVDVSDITDEAGARRLLHRILGRR